MNADAKPHRWFVFGPDRLIWWPYRVAIVREESARVIGPTYWVKVPEHCVFAMDSEGTPFRFWSHTAAQKYADELNKESQ